jgi:hypothetical protein
MVCLQRHFIATGRTERRQFQNKLVNIPHQPKRCFIALSTRSNVLAQVNDLRSAHLRRRRGLSKMRPDSQHANQAGNTNCT